MRSHCSLISFIYLSIDTSIYSLCDFVWLHSIWSELISFATEKLESPTSFTSHIIHIDRCYTLQCVDTKSPAKWKIEQQNTKAQQNIRAFCINVFIDLKFYFILFTVLFVRSEEIMKFDHFAVQYGTDCWLNQNWKFSIWFQIFSGIWDGIKLKWWKTILRSIDRYNNCARIPCCLVVFNNFESKYVFYFSWQSKAKQSKSSNIIHSLFTNVAISVLSNNCFCSLLQWASLWHFKIVSLGMK